MKLKELGADMGSLDQQPLPVLIQTLQEYLGSQQNWTNILANQPPFPCQPVASLTEPAIHSNEVVKGPSLC